jgi:hypothetical protein
MRRLLTVALFSAFMAASFNAADAFHGGRPHAGRRAYYGDGNAWGGYRGYNNDGSYAAATRSGPFAPGLAAGASHVGGIGRALRTAEPPKIAR